MNCIIIHERSKLNDLKQMRFYGLFYSFMTKCLLKFIHLFLYFHNKISLLFLMDKFRSISLNFIHHKYGLSDKPKFCPRNQ